MQTPAKVFLRLTELSYKPGTTDITETEILLNADFVVAVQTSELEKSGEDRLLIGQGSNRIVTQIILHSKQIVNVKETPDEVAAQIMATSPVAV